VLSVDVAVNESQQKVVVAEGLETKASASINTAGGATMIQDNDVPSSETTVPPQYEVQ